MIRLLRHEIVLSFEKAEQLNSKFCHRCLHHNSSLLRIGHFEHGWVFCKEEVVPRRDFSDFAKHIYHVGSSYDTHSIIQSGLIPGGKDIKKGDRRYSAQQWILCIHIYTSSWISKWRSPELQCTNKGGHTPEPIVITRANLRVAQKKGLTFYQARSDAIILHNTLPAACIEMVVAMSSGVQSYKMYESPRSLGKVFTDLGLARRPNGYYKHWREHPMPIPASTERLVAVKPTTGFKDHSTLQLN